MTKSIKDYFKNIILMSGTPAAYQRVLTKRFQPNECSCTPALAIENRWICKPTMHLVNCSEGSDWPSAVKAVLQHAITRCGGTPFRPTILANCKSINDVYALKTNDWFRERIGKEFHFIAIHSKKSEEQDGAEQIDMKPSIDFNEDIDRDECFKWINGLDADEETATLKVFNDDLPVIVAQVQMIGEGINVKSFNAVLTATNSEKTAMQQIGRALRNYTKHVKVTKIVEVPHEIEETVQKTGFFNKLLKKTEVIKKTVMIPETREETVAYTKLDDGHADVYVMYDNQESIRRLMRNLAEYDLTSECFDWGKRVDIIDGSTPNTLEEEDFAQHHAVAWNDIDDVIITELEDEFKYVFLIRQIENEWRMGVDNNENGIDDIDEFKDKVIEWNESGKLKLVTKIKSPKFNSLKNAARDIETLHEMKRQMMENIHERILNDCCFRKIWDKDIRFAFQRFFLDCEIGNFIYERLSEKSLKAIRGKKK